jgi:hypothetical protein
MFRWLRLCVRERKMMRLRSQDSKILRFRLRSLSMSYTKQNLKFIHFLAAPASAMKTMRLLMAPAPAPAPQHLF